MLLKFGGPYHGYAFNEVREFTDEEGQALVDSLGGEPRVYILDDLRAPAPAPVLNPAVELPSHNEDAELDALIAEEAAAEVED